MSLRWTVWKLSSLCPFNSPIKHHITYHLESQLCRIFVELLDRRWHAEPSLEQRCRWPKRPGPGEAVSFVGKRWRCNVPISAGLDSLRSGHRRPVHIQHAHHLNGFDKIKAPFGKLKNCLWIAGPQNVPTSRDNDESVAAFPGKRPIAF